MAGLCFSEDVLAAFLHRTFRIPKCNLPVLHLAEWLRRGTP